MRLAVTRVLVMARDAARTVAEHLSDDLGHRVEVNAVIVVHGARMPHAGFVFDGVKPVQFVQPSVETILSRIDLSGTADPEAALRKLVERSSDVAVGRLPWGVAVAAP